MAIFNPEIGQWVVLGTVHLDWEWCIRRRGVGEKLPGVELTEWQGFRTYCRIGATESRGFVAVNSVGDADGEIAVL